MENKNIVIIGGGITGLTAAFYLQKEIKERQLPYSVKLVEASDRLGGKIQTERRNGCVIERGPDSFLIRKSSGKKLAEDAGLGDQLVINGTGQSYILVGDKLRKMPSGSFMGIPTEVRPFLFSGIFSPKGKLRAGLDFVRPKGKPAVDQSLGLFFRRRFGDELVENLIEPLLSGIYAGDIDDLSLMATFPNFYQLEQEHGSLIRGLRNTMPKRKKPKSPKPGMFYSLKNGLGSLVEAIEAKLEPGTVITQKAVDHIEKKGEDYHLLLSDATTLKAQSIINTAPHFAVQRMLAQYDWLRPLKEMTATSVANIAMVFDQSAIKQDINGTGFVVSRNSDYRITACTWTHRKWPEFIPEGKVMLRCYLGKPGDEKVVDLPDGQLVNIALRDLNKIMDISSRPDFSVVSRWKDAMPQYSVGHKERVEAIEEKTDQELPGIFLAGNSYHGIGIPDCIDQGKAAVTKVLSYLEKR